MRRVYACLAITLGTLMVGCGDAAGSARTLDARSALASAPELLEVETPSTRQELLRELVRASEVQAGQPVGRAVFFAMNRDGNWIAAPGLDQRVTGLQLDAGASSVQLVFSSSRPEDRWTEERRDALHGLSEREAAELVARSLLTRWGIVSTSPVQVDRAVGVPYAAAYVDGILRLNPSFLYLAASPGSAPQGAAP